MHLCGPALTTTGKRKGKVKWASAEAKRQAEQLDKDWKEIKKKHGVAEEERKRKRAMSAEPLSKSYSLSVPAGRDTKHIKSLGQDNGVAVLKHSPVYTGTKVKGIATMHKSNAVPVFSDQEAVDISKMRR
jgi:hypothetical protein